MRLKKKFDYQGLKRCLVEKCSGGIDCFKKLNPPLDLCKKCWCLKCLKGKCERLENYIP